MTALLTVDVHLAPGFRRNALERDVRAGLTSTPKTLPPIWFYDERGSRLFDEITRLPEYYLTRAERAILDAHADEIAALTSADVLVELGSGTSEKTRILLDALAASGMLRCFVPLDVSETVLREAARDIRAAYGIDVRAVVGDFHHHLDQIPREGRRLVAFLGSTIGNLTPEQRRRFLFDLDTCLDYRDRILLGTDLVKDSARLVAAYDDAAGVTAAFNRNVLQMMNAELAADFELDAFDHVAVWIAHERWIEMRLRSTVSQTVTIRDLDLVVEFEEGEELRTEISAKFTPEQVRQELWTAGFVVEETWTDDRDDFMLTLARPYC
ncbi:MAG: L-histidine Nalpha-methyltransferase [Acidimicrobiaceae bacterium]